MQSWHNAPASPAGQIVQDDDFGVDANPLGHVEQAVGSVLENAAVVIVAAITVVPPITTSTDASNVPPVAAVLITTLVVAPVSAVLSVPWVDPCWITATPALSVIDCDEISNVHSFVVVSARKLFDGQSWQASLLLVWPVAVPILPGWQRMQSASFWTPTADE